MPLSVLRNFRARGHKVTVAFYIEKAVGLTHDAADDFLQQGDLVDLTKHQANEGFKELLKIIKEREIKLVLQIGAPFAYDQLALVRENLPSLQIWDWVFNTSIHFHNHSMLPSVFDGMIVESEYMRQRAAEDIRGMSSIQVIPSGAAPISQSKRTRTSEGTITLGYFGRMSAEKNPLGFVALAKQLCEKSKSLRFVMFGEGNEESAVRESISAWGQEAPIRFLGYAKDQQTAFSQMDFLVVPSLLDGRPAVIMEANHYGVPVLAYPTGGIPEMISEGENGFTLPKDPSAASQLLERFLDEPETLQLLFSTTQAYAKKHFSLSRMHDFYSKTFVELVDSKPRKKILISRPLMP
jgi:glycosyltransferase involved in cell wall biosynthesis